MGSADTSAQMEGFCLGHHKVRSHSMALLAQMLAPRMLKSSASRLISCIDSWEAEGNFPVSNFVLKIMLGRHDGDTHRRYHR